MSLKNICFIAVLALSLQACGHYSEDLAGMENPALQDIAPAAGGDFLAELSGQYMDLARIENDESYDHQAARYFTRKAKAASEGRMVYPATLRDFNIPKDQKGTVQDTRARLMSALETQNSFKNASTLAHAQTQFDSWLEQLEETNKQDHAHACRQKVEDALASLSDPVMNEVNYTLYFEQGKAALGAGSQNVIADTAAFLKENPYYNVTVIGYRDGQAGEYQRVAIERALEVRKALERAGVPGYLIRVTSEGMQAAYTPVSDGPQAKQNRRTNIILRLQQNRFL